MNNYEKWALRLGPPLGVCLLLTLLFAVKGCDKPEECKGIKASYRGLTVCVPNKEKVK